MSIDVLLTAKTRSSAGWQQLQEEHRDQYLMLLARAAYVHGCNPVTVSCMRVQGTGHGFEFVGVVSWVMVQEARFKNATPTPKPVAPHFQLIITGGGGGSSGLRVSGSRSLPPQHTERGTALFPNTKVRAASGLSFSTGSELSTGATGMSVQK